MDRLSPHGIRTAYQPSRRGFLIAMMGAGVMLGYARSGLAAVEFLASGAQELLPSGKQGESSVGELFEPTIWYGIDPSGAVTINIIRAEMGQHVGTALARIVADELEADWSKVKIVEVDTDPKWGEMITGGSWSVWQSFPVLSRAGAAGRNSNQGAGQTPPHRARRASARCSVKDQRQGSLWHRRGGRRHDLRPSQSSTHPLRFKGGID